MRRFGNVISPTVSGKGGEGNSCKAEGKYLDFVLLRRFLCSQLVTSVQKWHEIFKGLRRKALKGKNVSSTRIMLWI